MDKLYGVLWLIWLGIFAILEWRAVKNPRLGDTLSEWVWWASGHPLPWALLAALMIWLTAHFLFKL